MAAVSWPPCIEPQARKEEYFGLETEPTSTHLSQLKFQLSAASGCAAPFENETWIASAMIIASSADRAMTVREWDPALQRSAWGYGHCWPPLPDSHGSVNWRRLFRFLVG